MHSTDYHIRLLTEGAVEQFFLRLFLRNPRLRSLTLVSPFMDMMKDCRFSLADLSLKIQNQRIPTYLITHAPVEPRQLEAVDLLAANDWVEIRFNESLPQQIPNQSHLRSLDLAI